jgi:hypothetical protein
MPLADCDNSATIPLCYAPANLHRPARLFVSAAATLVFGVPAVVVAVCCAIHIVVMFSNPIRGTFACSLAYEEAVRAMGVPLEAALPIFVMAVGIGLVAGIQLIRIVNVLKSNRRESRTR